MGVSWRMAQAKRAENSATGQNWEQKGLRNADFQRLEGFFQERSHPNSQPNRLLWCLVVFGGP